MKKVVYILMVALALFSCQKEEIKDPIVDSVPVFTANVQLDGSSTTLEAGVEDVYMSTYSELVNGVNKYSGKLGTEEVYIELGVFQGDLDIYDPFSLKNFQGVLHFASMPQGPLAVLSKDEFPNASFIDHIIWYKDGIQAGYNQLTIMQPGKYQICAEVHFNDGQTHSLCNELILGYNTNGDCRIKHLLGIYGDLHVWLEEPFSQINEVKWYLDGVFVSDDQELEMDIDQNEHLVEALITFTSGSIRKKSILVDGSMSGHLINDFTYVENGQFNQIRWDYGVVLNLRMNGKDYTTLTANNLDSSVEISEIEYFGLNAQGKKVYKCSGIINASVREVGTNTIVPVNISTTFGLEMN